jgi:ribosomal protein L29
MKKSNFQELKKHDINDLRKKLNVSRSGLRSLRFDLAAGKIKNVSLIHKTKKDIARILTAINAK